MFKSRSHRNAGSPLLTIAFLSVPLLLLGLLAWGLIEGGKKEGRAALSGGRLVTISLPSGLVQGGVKLGDKPSEAATEQTTEATAEAVALIPPPGEGLKAAPNPDLVEATTEGPLPIIGPDGTKPWQYYARGVDGMGDGPRISVVVTGLGFSRQITDAALRLPPAISLSFSPYVAEVGTWAASARALGHEVLVDLPMEPADFPAVDPGPQALLSSLAPDVNYQRLRWVLSRFPGHIGVVAGFSERFTANAEAAEAPMKALAARGVMLVYTGTNVPVATSGLLGKVKLPHVAATGRIEEEATREEVAAALLSLENAARKEGSALLVIPASLLAVEAVGKWVETFGKKGIILAPVSALASARFS